EGRQHGGQRAEVLQVFGNHLPTQQAPQHEGRDTADDDATGHRAKEDLDRMTFAMRHDGLVHQHREQRADRIDDDAFPTQHVGDACIGSNGAQHGRDHRGPGHAGQGTEQQRQLPTQAPNPVRRGGQHQQGRHRPIGDQAADGVTNALQLTEAQGQAALEQDHGHRQGHHGEQEVAQQGVRP
ncbi:hypothetical protein KCV01_g12114, partial [Aureobasidium melanogenum]